MYKRILSFVLILCMGMCVNTNVYAKEVSEFSEESVIAVDDSEEAVVVDEADLIPQNGSEVNMQQQQMRFGLRNKSVGTRERYTVLVLDTSASVQFLRDETAIYTADTALPYVKKASKKFIADISKASGNNYIAIVAYGGSSTRVISNFSTDTASLDKKIDALYSSGDRSVYDGLGAAETLIDSVNNKNAIKNVVLFTTGMTSNGDYSYEGHYNTSTVGSRWYNMKTGVNLYAYANSAYAKAEELKEKSTIYSIGLFNIMENMPEEGRDVVQLFKLCASDWASSRENFYDVKNPDELEFAFGQVAENIVKCTGAFSYPGTETDYTSTYYYDDNYFKNSSYIYNQSLATMSLCLELSAWGSSAESDYTKKMKNAQALLEEIGFTGFDHNYTDFAEEGKVGKPTKDSVGSVIANKQITFGNEDYTLIAVAVRGGGYEREWASNFKIGTEGNHEGFSEARDIVIDLIENYIQEQGITGKLKFWVTGFSRAAATANMVAGAIDNKQVDLGNCTLELSDLFAYTFETPAGVIGTEKKAAKYNNIFNIVNKNDPVPMVAPGYWGFGRYGKDRFLSTAESDGITTYTKNKNAMLTCYQEMSGYEGYTIDDFTMKKINIDGWRILPGGKPFISIEDDTKNANPQSAFLDSYVKMLTKDFLKSRDNFVSRYQSGIRDACGIFFGTDSAKKDKLFELVKNKFSNNWKTILGTFLNPFKGEMEAYALVSDYLKECLDDAGITNYSRSEFESSVQMLCDLVLAVASNHPNLASTLIYNLDGIGQAHYPELCLAWMQSMDKNYTTDAGLSFSNGKYRVIRINCPVDVAVYDAQENKLAAIINNTPQENGQVVAVFSEDDEKLIYLPVDKEYVVKLTATGDGYMNYAVSEFDSNVGETNHLVLFNDIPITNGQKYVSVVPAYSEDDIENTSGKVADSSYNLSLGDTPILVSEELKGEEVFDAYHYVMVQSEDETKGIVFGSGTRQYGSFAKVTAEASEGCEFAGWYIEGNLVSMDEEYKFRVTGEVEIAAAFVEKQEQGKTLDGTFRVVSHWNSGFRAEITLTNNTDEVIHDWVVAFDLPYDIVGIWNGVIVNNENGIYTVKNAGYNSDIEPGQSVTFGFNAHAETEKIIEPTQYDMVDMPSD